VRGAIQDFIETRTSYRVDSAGDGRTAIRIAEQGHCDIALLDVAMPEMNGIETASILRDRVPRMKIVGFSVLASDADMRAELLATKQFDAVLSKLDGLPELVKALKALLPDNPEQKL
jgi:CheY-like chemotaxis protein